MWKPVRSFQALQLDHLRSRPLPRLSQLADCSACCTGVEHHDLLGRFDRLDPLGKLTTRDTRNLAYRGIRQLQRPRFPRQVVVLGLASRLITPCPARYTTRMSSGEASFAFATSANAFFRFSRVGSCTPSGALQLSPASDSKWSLNRSVPKRAVAMLRITAPENR